MKHSRAALFVALATAFSLAFSAGAMDKVNFKHTDLKGRFGGTLFSAASTVPLTFNPLAAADAGSRAAVAASFDSLTEINPETLQLEPALAEKWSVSRDGLQWTLDLRRGVCWSDGVAFTSDDVVFTFAAYLAPQFRSIWWDKSAPAGTTLKVTRVDSNTVRLVTNAPFPLLLWQLPPMLPRHIFEQPFNEGRAQDLWQAGASLEGIVGTGAFIPAEYHPGQYLLYQRNPHYWRSDRSGNRLPYGDRWMVKLVPGSKIPALFSAGESDWAVLPGNAWDSFRKKERTGRYECIDGGVSLDGTYLTFNQNPQAPAFESRSYAVQWFQTRQFRQAVAFAVDQSAIIKRVYLGQATERRSPVSPVLKSYYSTHVDKYDHSTRKASGLLEEAGFKTGRDKVLCDAEGHAVEFTILANADVPEHVQTAHLIAGFLEPLGIRASVNALPALDYGKALGDTGDWQVAIVALPGHPEPGALRDIWVSSGGRHYWFPRQAAPRTPWEASADQLLDRAAASDPRERTSLYNEWQGIIARELPVICLPEPRRLAAVAGRISNAAFPAYGGIEKLAYGLWIGFNP